MNTTFNLEPEKKNCYILKLLASGLFCDITKFSPTQFSL